MKREMCCVYPTRDEKFIQNLSEMLKALSDDQRLKLLYLMKDFGEICNCECDLSLDIRQSTVSHHISILKKAGLIEDRKEGKWAFYSLKEKTSRLLEELEKEVQSI
ncbi:MAG: ArsR/SmtB family transcription factor [Candidatus Methanofastidiosia archaeon]